MIEKYDYVFAENGLVAYKDGKFLSKQVSVKFTIVGKKKFAKQDFSLLLQCSPL